jgi:serine/threonine protein kinase
LFDRIVEKTFYNEKEAKDLVQILLSAIKYCHDRNIVHRDLKPENLLLTSKRDSADVKIADFGFAVECTDESLTARYDLTIEMSICVITLIRV